MISNTITSRALEIVTTNPTNDILEAVKQAIIEENTLIAELLENRSERAKNLTSLMCQKVYNKHNNIK
jgi:hypothetical protein